MEKEDTVKEKLYRSRKDSTIAGVCGGLGEYFNVDPTFIRIIAVLLIFADGIGLWTYLIAWIIIPRRPLEESAVSVAEEKKEKPEYSPWNKYIPGAILILLGIFFILRENYWWWDIERFWPLLLIAFGVFLIVKLGKRQETKEEGVNESSQI